MLPSLMIKTLDSLSKASRAQCLKPLIPIAKVVEHHSLVVSLLIIVAIIKYVHLLQPLDLSLAGHEVSVIGLSQVTGTTLGESA